MKKKIPEKRMFDLDLRRFTQDDGTFEAYICTWDTVDSFGTRFKKGAFKKTINERLKNGDIKLLWQHEINEPIGLVLGAVEDAHGVLIHGKLDIGVPRADQARMQMGSRTINQFSFGFDIIKQARAKDGFVDISEVRWWEASPVTFGANSKTSVVHVRSYQFTEGAGDEVAQVLFPADDEKFFTLGEDGGVLEVGAAELEAATRALVSLNAEFDGGSGQQSLPGSADGSLPKGSGSPSLLNAVDFDESFDQAEFGGRGFKIMDALFDTLLDILYSYEEHDMVALSDAAFEKAQAKFVSWVGELSTRSMRAIDPRKNTLSEATETVIEGRALEDVAQDSTLSLDELSLLIRGRILPLAARGRLAEFSKPVATAHSKVRAESVLNLFEEIRASGFSQAETIRLRALLDRQIAVEPDDEPTALLKRLRAINQEITDK